MNTTRIYSAAAVNCNPVGTSFHNGIVEASVNDLISIFGIPDYNEPDSYYKVTIEWDLVYDIPNGNRLLVFTIYDMYEDDSPGKNLNKVYQFHIGTDSNANTEMIVDYLSNLGLRAYVKKCSWE